MFLVTGGNGFVGRELVAEIARRGLAIRSTSRSPPVMPLRGVNYIIAPSLGSNADWMDSLRGVSIIIHTAARLHAMSEQSTDGSAEYRRINVDGTISLAEQASRAGVKRLVFLSSIKVNGEVTAPGRPYTETDAPAPNDAYGQSKLDAELGLHEIASKTGLEVVILRPTMIYGPGVKGNFARLIKLVRLGIPLPLKSVNNRRSMISLKNCVDLILCAATNKKAAGNTYLMSDGHDLSTPELLTRLGNAMDRPVHLFSFPRKILEIGASLLNQGDIAKRLIGNLQVDIIKAQNELGWIPIQSIDGGLRDTVQTKKLIKQQR